VREISLNVDWFSENERLLDSQSREETRGFLQKRVARFGLMLALIFGMFFVWRLASALSGDDSPSFAFLPWQGVSVAAFGAQWLVCRGRPRSLRFVRALEFTGLCVAGGAATMMAWRISYAAHPDFILLLCLSYTLILRAIMVPSTARRTLVYGLLFAVPFLLSVFFIHRTKHDPSIYTLLSDPRLRLDSATIAGRWTVVAGIWWIAGLLITTATSKVIYGLRQEVRDARRLGQYTLTEKLGQGGMGVVYRATHAMLRRPSAIKLLLPDKLGPESAARFEREVQLTARLTHPNTIRVFDYGRTPEGVFYYVMEYLEGASLDEVIEQTGPMPPGRVIQLLDQVAGALSEAHGIGLIHRDIKPANIFLTEQGGVPDVAKVLDFGLVKQVDQAEVAGTSGAPLTRDNAITGTPQYMSPESLTSPESLSASTDLYSLGAVGYFLLTGQHVFTGQTLIEVCGQHLHTQPEPPSKRLGAALPADLERLVLACLEKAPERRPESARALQVALRTCEAAHAWSEDDARKWLETHESGLRQRKSRSSVRGTATIAVDLGVGSRAV
jgi:eukaryotic-like serine/threonine-protein kinase